MLRHAKKWIDFHDRNHSPHDFLDRFFNDWQRDHDQHWNWCDPRPAEPRIEYRSFDGSQNNPFDPGLNAAGTEFGRIGPAHFADGISIPVGGNNPRTISNLVVGAGDAGRGQSRRRCPRSCTPGASSSITT